MEADSELRTALGVSVVRFPFEHVPTHLLRSLLFSVAAAVWLSANSNRYTIVQIDGATTIAASDVNASHFVHAAWRRSAAHVSRYDRGIYGAYHSALGWINEVQERAAYRRAKRIIAVSHLVKRELVALGVKAADVDIISLGVDASKFTRSAGDRKRFGLPADVFIALFAGDLKTPRKNLESVLRALASAPNVHLAVVGTQRRNHYGNMARRLGVASQVTFLGFRSDIADVMQACNAFVFPSQYEPFGLVVLEAMASGLPVVTARSTGASDVVDAESGYVIDDACDEQAIAQFLRKLAEDEDLRYRMGEAARRRAEHYSWDAVADAFLAAYERAASAKRRVLDSA